MVLTTRPLSTRSTVARPEMMNREWSITDPYPSEFPYTSKCAFAFPVPIGAVDLRACGRFVLGQGDPQQGHHGFVRCGIDVVVDGIT